MDQQEQQHLLTAGQHFFRCNFQTTILYKLKLGEVVTTIPTIGKYFPSVSNCAAKNLSPNFLRL